MTFREHKERPFSSLWAHFQAVEAGSWQAQGCAAQVPPPETWLLLAYGSRSEQQIHPSCWTVWFVPGLTVKHHSADEYLELPCVHSVLANSPVPPVPRGLVEKGCYGSMLCTSHTSTAYLRLALDSCSLLAWWHPNTSYEDRETPLLHVDG